MASEACCVIESPPELGDDAASIQSSIVVMNERLARLQSITGRIEAKVKAFGSSAPPTADVKEGSSSTFYEKLFGGVLTHHHLWWLFIFAINSAWVAFVFAGHSRAERGDLATTFALVNLVATIAIRDGTFLLILYKIVVRIPWQKYFFNRMLHCNGGIHTGCAMMLLFWTIVSLSMSIAMKKGKGDIVMLAVLCFGLLLMMLLAMPAVRERHHNVFEGMHRYLGWSLLFLLTAILVKNFSKSHAKWRSTQAIVDSVLMLMSLILVFYSWFLIERQRVEIYVGEQGNIVVVRLQGRARAGAFARISLNLVEWHSFSVAFSDRKNRSYGLIVGVAGDWTKRLAQKCIHNSINMNRGQVVDEFFSAEIDLEDPRAAAHHQRTIKTWIRWHRPLGFMYSLYAYKRVICVGTGAGIAPILPHIGNQSTQMHVVWIAKNHWKIYGDEICNKVFQHPDHTIYDTAKQRFRYCHLRNSGRRRSSWCLTRHSRRLSSLSAGRRRSQHSEHSLTHNRDDPLPGISGYIWAILKEMPPIMTFINKEGKP